MSIDRSLYLSEVPLLFPLIFFAAGIAAGTSLAIPWWGVLLGVAFVSLIYLVFKPLARFAIYFLIALAGTLLGKAYTPGNFSEPSKIELKGRVEMIKDYGESYRIIVESQENKENYLAWISDYDREILKGDIVEIQGIAITPQPITTVPDELTNERFLLENKIFAEIVMVDSFRVVRVADGIASWPIKINRYLANKLRHIGLTQESEKFLQAVLLGEIDLEQEVRDDFSRSGLSHVLALSGTHVAAISMIIAMLFFPLTLFGRRKIGQLSILMLLWLYAMVTGLSPSVLRAVIMISLVVIGQIFARNVKSFNVLCAAALLMLLFSPLSIYSMGFQLSFLAVAGILLFMPMLMEPIITMKNKGLRSWLIKICPYLFLPICAVASTAPLSIYYFHLFPAWFLITNLIVGALLPFIIFGGITLLIFSLLGVEIGWLAHSLNLLIDSTINIGHEASLLQPSELINIYPTAIWLIITYLTLILIWLAWNNRRKVYLYAAGICGISTVAVLWLGSPKYPQHEVFEWRTANSFNILYRDGGDAYLITDASTKYHGSLRRTAEFKLTHYLGRRNARLRGVFSDSLVTAHLRIFKDIWIIDGKSFLVVSDANMVEDSLLIYRIKGLQPRTVIISHGFKGDATAVVKAFPDARIEVAPSLYAPIRKRILNHL